MNFPVNHSHFPTGPLKPLRLAEVKWQGPRRDSQVSISNLFTQIKGFGKIPNRESTGNN